MDYVKGRKWNEPLCDKRNDGANTPGTNTKCQEPFSAAVWYALRRYQGETIAIDKSLIFEEKQPVAFEVLGLGHWS